MARTLGIVCAVLLHAGFLLFGGLIFPKDGEDKGTLQEVQLLAEDDTAEEEEKKPEEPKPQDPEELKADEEEVPNAEQVAQSLDVNPLNDAPALDAASLSAIEQALNGQASSGGDFADSLNFGSGGRIGGTGRAGSELGDATTDAFDLSEIDQKPRATFQTAPQFPSELRGKKIEGVVIVIFVVDESGKVLNPRVEKSTHPAFEQPALDAVKQWKFEPAVRGGKRVTCPMRQSIRFQPS
ncbi:MAG: energy transducer TonB [Planctomycetes bacterium]|nr:energy transducer TonB [Planctomycetota bacterium]